MSRTDEYNAFAQTQPSLPAVVTKVQDQRRIVDKTLTWARLKFAAYDYHPLFVLKGIFDGNKTGNIVIDEKTKTRYGWKRWEEIRDRIDAIDQWLKMPADSNKLDILKEAMVSIPDSIDYELGAMARVLKGGAEYVEHKLENAGSAILGLAAPVIALYVAGTAYNLTKKK